MPTFSDDFNRADGALGSNWAAVTGLGALAIIGQQVSAASPTVCANAVATGAGTFAADQEASITVPTLGGSDFTGPAVRVSAGGGTGYAIYTDGGNTSTRGVYAFNGTALTRISSVNFPCSANDLLTLRVVGTDSSLVLTALRNGTVVETIVNPSTTYNSGQPGILYEWQNSRATRGDNFTATDSLGGGPNKFRPYFITG
jgi:hypothetical protein